MQGPDQPLVSVVIPSRNRRVKLLKCLDGLSLQTYVSFEVIVVDDASTDDTPAEVARFAQEHPGLRLMCLRNEPGRGANPSRNRGVRESKGELVAFLDDDCVPEPGWLTAIVADFTADRVAAVTGLVENVPARNIYELTWRGTQRVHGKVHASRLVGCNMCVRRPLLLRFMLDEDRAGPAADMSVSGRGDEEGLYLQLKAAGYEQRVAHDARVLHDHPHTARSFFRQGYRSGGAAARLGYKYRLPLRVELMPLLAAWLLLPAAWAIHPAWQAPWAWLVPLASFGLFLAAISYNEISRKGKTPIELLMTMPVLLGYYNARLIGYLVQLARLYLGMDRLERIHLPRPAEPPS